MDISTILVALMFVTLFGFLLTGFPVAFTLAGTGLLFGGIGLATGALDSTGIIELLPNRMHENIVRNELLFAIPLFVMMGVMLERSKIAEDLLESMGKLFGSLRGGLGISVTIVGALLAASTGIVGATVVTMGLLSLPTMLKRGYDTRLAAGSIAAAGTLGQIIPPSIVLILLAEVLSNSWSEAQREMGIFSVSPMSAGELFAGALIPGLVLVAMYIGWQIFIAIAKPSYSPPVMKKGEVELNTAFFKQLIGTLVPPLVLIIAVLGSILGGIATPTEAASVGTVGAILLGAARLFPDHRRQVWIALTSLVGLLIIAGTFDLRMTRDDVPLSDMIGFGLAVLLSLMFAYCLMTSIWRLYRQGTMGEVSRSTVRISTMIYAILIGAALFSLVFRDLGGDDIIADILSGLPGGYWGALAVVMLVMFVLGFFLDFIEITFVIVPIVAPALLMMDGSLGPIWLGVMMAMNLQTSFLTPPFGFALFYLRGVAPPEVKTTDIYKGVMPFIAIQVVALIALVLFPDLATWLPETLFG